MVYTTTAKQIEYVYIGVFFLFGEMIPSFVHPTFMSFAKTQIARVGLQRIYIPIFYIDLFGDNRSKNSPLHKGSQKVKRDPATVSKYVKEYEAAVRAAGVVLHAQESKA